MGRKIKVALALLLLLCLMDMPYGFYQLVRFIGLIGFSVLAYQANESSRQAETIAYVVLAVLFQPFFKIALGREIWNVIDVIVAIGLLGSLVVRKSKPKV